MSVESRLARTTLWDKLLRWACRLALAGIVVFALAPAVFVVLLSFGTGRAIKYPPDGYGLDQYRAFFESDRLTSGLRESLIIALPVALVSVVVGVLCVFAVARTRLRGKGAVRGLAIVPLLIPNAVLAISMYVVMAQLGLVGTRLGLILVHVLVAVPYVVIVVGSTIERIPRDLDLVAMSLGASRARAWAGITLRLLVPAVGAGFLFAFLASFDEAVFVNFIGGAHVITLPKVIYDSVRLGVDPAITAVSTLLMVGSGVLMGAMRLLRRRR